jgi:aminoglycoside N3'-acetyltransferase
VTATESADIGRLRAIIYSLLLERATLMASIETLNTSIKDLEADVTALVRVHSSCPTTQQVQAAVASVQALSASIKAAVAKDPQG